MGFDNECIQNIQSLAGEYFCPVCRLLVYPDEALYTQCTHLYCKPCLAYVVSTTHTCPYDGYPVADADAKPVTEANKELAETIGRIAVNCLYHRSGCTWQGTLSETAAHCAGCAFGNSPVVCNRCGAQIVHRQVQEHAQICPGEQPPAQQADNATAGTEQNQAATQAGAPASQSQTSETAAAPAAGQGQNQGASNAQPQAVPQVAPTPEQWYQQQQQYYQQYYQQYPGYDPYQQQYQQYIQYEQQLQAHPQQVIQGQPQPQPYVQPQPQPQPQTQVHPQPHAQLQGQAQAPAYPQPHPQPQTQPQAQPHPHLQPQPAAQSQIQAHAPQPLPHASVQSHPQMLPQSHAQPIAQQQIGHSYPQGQPHLQPHPQQHPQMTQHPQPHPQMQHPQPHPQPQQPQPQPHAYPQPHLQHHPQMQPQPHPQPQSQMHPHPLPQPQHPAAQAVTGHQSYPQPQLYQQMPPGTPQQPVHMHPQQQGTPHQMQSQFPPQQPSQVCPPQNLPPHSHVQQHLQEQVMMPTQGQHPHVPPVQQQLAHHPGRQIHHQPGMQPPQQQSLPQQQPHYPQQQAHAPAHQAQSFPGQASGVVLNQQPQQSSFAPAQAIQQPQQSLCPQGLPLQQQAHSHPQLQQNMSVAQSLPTHHPQNLAGRPMLPNQGALHQRLLQTPVGSAGPLLGQDIHVGGKMVQPGVGQPSWMTNCLKMAPDQQVVPSQHSLLRRSDNQSTLLPVSPSSGTNAPLSSANASLKQVLPEKKQVDSVPGKASEVPKLDADETNVNVSVTNNEAATSAELRNPKAENVLKSLEGEDKILGGSDDKIVRSDHAVNEITDSSLKHGKVLELSEKDDDLEEPVIKQMVKDETSEKLDSTEDAKELKASQHAVKEVQDGLPHNLEVQDVKLRQEAGDLRVPRPWPDASGSVQSHPVTDKGPQGHALGTVSEWNIHPLHPPNAIQGYERAVPHSAYPNRNLPQFPRHGLVPDERRGLLAPGQMPAKNFVQPPHLTTVPDQERHRQLPMPYGPSSHMQDCAPQRPPALDRMLPPSLPLPGPERNFQEPVANRMQMQGLPMVHMRPQGHNALECFPHHQQGQPSSVQDHFQTPMEKQPHNSFHSELPPGGIPGRAMPTAFGREPGLLGPPQSFEPRPAGPHEHGQGLMPPPYPGGQRTQGEPLSGVPPGAFDSAGSMMPRGPLVPEGRPRPPNLIEAEMFENKRPGFFEGRELFPQLPVNLEINHFGQHLGIRSNPMKVYYGAGKGLVGVQESFLHGLREERSKSFLEDKYNSGLEEGLKPPPEDRFKPFSLDPGRRVIDGREFEDLKQFPRPAHLDGENMSRPLDRGPHVFGDRPPHLLSHEIGLKSDGNAGGPSGGSFPVDSGNPFHPVDTGDRLHLPRPDNLGRTADPSGAPPDFLRHVSEFDRHRMDNLPPLRSPGREHSGLPPSRFGSSPAGLGLGIHPGLNDFDGRDLRGFGECWSGVLPAPLCRGELDGPGNLRINEQLGSGRPVHLRSGDMVGPDIMPIYLRGGEPCSLLNHVRGGDLRNLPGHLRVGVPLGPGHLHIGEPTGYGGIPSHLRIGGLGHLPPHLRIGDTVGAKSFPSHVRIGEPGFGSGFPMQGLQASFQGDMESLEHSRKRKPGSTGWCRICKVDCETLEGLEMHSQTREHQKMAMDMVLSIKQDNSKKKKLSSEENVSREDANKLKKASFENRGTRN